MINDADRQAIQKSGSLKFALGRLGLHQVKVLKPDGEIKSIGSGASRWGDLRDGMAEAIEAGRVGTDGQYFTVRLK